jgi:hypothetical protein
MLKIAQNTEKKKIERARLRDFTILQNTRSVYGCVGRENEERLAV